MERKESGGRMIVDINELSKIIHSKAKEKGFYDGEFNLSEKLMLIVSELGEAQESDRKNRKANLEYFLERQKELVADEGKVRAFESSVKDTLEDELADALIRILDLCGYLKIDIGNHVEIKMWYNSTRPEKHGKKY
jgi:NTP pyrophosphatase (non-canonical NTP hydrolase)